MSCYIVVLIMLCYIILHYTLHIIHRTSCYTISEARPGPGHRNRQPAADSGIPARARRIPRDKAAAKRLAFITRKDLEREQRALNARLRGRETPRDHLTRGLLDIPSQTVRGYRTRLNLAPTSCDTVPVNSDELGQPLTRPRRLALPGLGHQV